MTKNLLIPLLSTIALASSAVVLGRVVPNLEKVGGIGLFFLLYGASAAIIWWLAAWIGHGVTPRSDIAGTFFLPCMLSFPLSAICVFCVAFGVPAAPVRIMMTAVIGFAFVLSIASLPLNREPPVP